MEIDPEKVKKRTAQLSDYSKAAEIDNNDSTNYMEQEDDLKKTRRSKKITSKYRERETSVENSSSDSSSSSKETDYERNPGNPYTVYKDKYKQNWLWNHYMDGDHMNVNPYAPQFVSVGPSGAALFFGRKWWYFNQDDFKPLN